LHQAFGAEAEWGKDVDQTKNLIVVLETWAESPSPTCKDFGWHCTMADAAWLLLRALPLRLRNKHSSSRRVVAGADSRSLGEMDIQKQT
jgi:hypothetical protein